MNFIEIAYIISSLVALGAGIPQIHQLLIEKRSDEFSLSSWGMWAGTQVVSLMYAVSINNPILIAMNVMWVAFYLFMLVLVLKYRPNQQLTAQQELTEPVALSSD